jgi:hypothetical protein
MDVLYKHGMQGVAGLVLRKEFVEAAELLKKVLLLLLLLALTYTYSNMCDLQYYVRSCTAIKCASNRPLLTFKYRLQQYVRSCTRTVCASACEFNLRPAVHVYVS